MYVTLTALLLLFTGFSGMNTANAQDAAETANMEVWSGTLDTGNGALRLKLEIKQEDDKKTAVLISVDQGNVRIPIDTISMTEGKLSFGLSAINGGFEGTLNDDKNTASGTWSQNGLDLPLELTKDGTSG